VPGEPTWCSWMPGFLPVSDDRAAAVGAVRRDPVNGALETVERRRDAISLGDAEGLVVVVAAHLARRHAATPLL
jgi:hypothetical protein